MIELDNIDNLAAAALEKYLVRKNLVRTFSRQFPVPTYVEGFPAALRRYRTDGAFRTTKECLPAAHGSVCRA